MKVLLVATVQSHIVQFHKPLVEMLHSHGCEVHVAARNNLAEKNGLALDFADKVFDLPFQRSPFSLKNITAYKRLKKIISGEHYDVIHCNTPVGGVLGRLAARSSRKKGTKVFYTAHGFHFYKGAPKINWLLWYPIEKICAHLTDAIITINKEDYAIAKKKLKAMQVEYIHGAGVDVTKFKNAVVNAAEKRKELNVPENTFLLLSVGELNENKNHQVVIQALAQLNNKNIHYIIAGNGPFENNLVQLATQLGVSNRVHLLGYRRDVAELYKISNAFVFSSKREGLGLAAIEAMSAGIPVICSDNRGTREYAKDGINALVCDNSRESYVAAINRLLRDRQLSAKMVQAGLKCVIQFSINEVNHKMADIYSLNEYIS